MSQPSALSADQIAAFERDGFLAIDSLVPPEDLVAIELEYEALLDRLAHELFDKGKISSAFDTLEFGDRYAAVIAE